MGRRGSLITKMSAQALDKPRRKRSRSYSFLNSRGEIEKFKSIREFSDRYSMPYSMARSLHAGMRVRLKGFCSTSSKPKARKYRRRFLTRLVNTKTGETKILGGSVKCFAKDHGLSLQGLSELVNKRVQIYRHWVLGKTLDAVSLDTPDRDF